MSLAVIVGAALAITWLTQKPENNGGRMKSSEEIDEVITTGKSLPKYTDYPHEITEAKAETSNDDEEVEGEEYINPSMEYKALATDYVNKWFLAQKSNVFFFLQLVVNSFNEAIRDYCSQRKIDPERIRFVYKGGNILRIVANEFVLELPGHASDVINDFYTQFFKRSDADFSIYIDPKLSNFDEVLSDLTTMSWIIQQTIRQQIEAEPEKYLDVYRLNAEAQIKMLDEFLNDLKSSESLKDPTNAVFFGGKFEGAEYRAIGQHSGIKPIDRDAPDMFIALDSTKKQTVTFSPNTINQNLRIQVNTALDFGKGKNRSVFNLVRTKVLFPVRFVNESGRVSTMHFGGELLDVSLPNKLDQGLKKFFDTPGVISKYELQQPGEKSIVFFAYTLKALIEDLDHILFEFNDHPWDDTKYAKRLNRLFYLCFVDLFVKLKSNDERKSFMKKWCKSVALLVTPVKTTKISGGGGDSKASTNLAFDMFAKRINSVKQPATSSRYIEYSEFIEQIQKNCIVVLTALKNIGTFCSDSWTLSKNSMYQANLDALIHGE